jgi:pyrroline-5-carboxylate reductase
MASISIIGSGNLGAAIARGLIASGRYSPRDILLCRRQVAKLEEYAKLGARVSDDVGVAARASDVVMICVQPNQFEAIAAEIGAGLRNPGSVVVSTMTGIGLAEVAAGLGAAGIPIFRAMPNTAIAVRESMTCLCSLNADEAQRERCVELFRCLGEAVEIEEGLMKAATVLAASNIAFVMRMIRAIIQGGIQLGFHSEDAQQIATQVVKGAASLLKANASHPEMEIDRVTTPRGCTIEGLNEMEHQGLSSAIIKGLVASYDKIARIRDTP